MFDTILSWLIPIGFTRATKTVGNTTTKYFLDGSTILAQQTGNTTIPFYYDANGKRIAFKYNGEMYFYVYNLQGDVTHIMKGDKTIVGTYTYDAWGKITNLNSLTAIAQINPFRYRGYYYDTESGLYYLNSRYYNPDWGRFINADGLVSTGQDLLGFNMFAYCCDNPIKRIDPLGDCYYDKYGNWRHDNWEFSGGYVRKPAPGYIDITKDLNASMKRNSTMLNDYKKQYGTGEATALFINKVKPGGEWDFKSQKEWNLNKDTIYRYNEQYIRYDDIGNIHYGYIGRVMFSRNMLLVAGGLVQIAAGTSNWNYRNSNFDDPHDQWAISFGCNLWDKGLVT